MPLPHVNTGSPHVAAHNAERDAINDLETNKADKSAVSGDLDALTTEVGKKATNTRVDAVEDDVDSLHETKADKSDTYTKAQVDSKDKTEPFSGTSVPSSTNANDLTTPGVYKVNPVTLALNYPVDTGAMQIEVFVLGSTILQRATGFTGAAAGRGFFIRRHNGTWESWRFVPTYRTVTSVTQPGVESYLWEPGANAERALQTINTPLGTVDLNQVTMPGVYIQGGTINATTARNYPTEGLGGILEVFDAGNTYWRLQRFTAFVGTSSAGRVVYMRRQTAIGSWQPWYTLPEIEVSATELKVWDPSANVQRSLAVAPLSGTFLGTTNLDSITAPGVYRQDSTSNATVDRKYPKDALTGILEVYRDSSDFPTYIQRYTPRLGTTNVNHTARVFYVRSMANGVYQEWRAYPSHRINSPAGQPGVEVFTWDDVNNREVHQSIVQPQSLGTTNLDLVTAPGQYSQGTGTNVSVANGYPVTFNTPGILEVIPMGGWVMQRFTLLQNTNARGFWTRMKNSTTWGPWNYTPSHRVDNAAGRAIYTWDETANREQLIYGDTGWREVGTEAGPANLLLNGWVSQQMHIRRIGRTVHLRMLQLRSDTGPATGERFMDLPAGFRHANVWITLEPVNYVGTNFRMALDRMLELKHVGGTWPPPADKPVIYGNGRLAAVQWLTEDPWPATLPGTPNGSIPNL